MYFETLVSLWNTFVKRILAAVFQHHTNTTIRSVSTTFLDVKRQLYDSAAIIRPYGHLKYKQSA